MIDLKSDTFRTLSDPIYIGVHKIDEIWKGNIKVYPEYTEDWIYIELFNESGSRVNYYPYNMWTDGANIYYMTNLGACRIFDRSSKTWRRINVYDSDDYDSLTSGAYTYYDSGTDKAYIINDSMMKPPLGNSYTFNKSSKKWIKGTPLPTTSGRVRFADAMDMIRLSDNLMLIYERASAILSGDEWTQFDTSSLFDGDVSSCSAYNIWSDCKDIFCSFASWSAATGLHRTSCHKYSNGIFRKINVISDDNNDKCGCHVWTDGVNAYDTEGDYSYSGKRGASSYIYDRSNNKWNPIVMTCRKKDDSVVTSDQGYKPYEKDRFPISGERVWTDGIRIFCSGLDGNTYIYKNRYNHTPGNYYRFAGYGSTMHPGNKFYRK